MKTFTKWLETLNSNLSTATIFSRLQHIWEDHFGEFTKQAFMREKQGNTALQDEFINIEMSIMQYLNTASMGDKRSQVIIEKALEKLKNAIDPFDPNSSARIEEFLEDIFIGNRKFPKQFLDQSLASNAVLINQWMGNLPRLNWNLLNKIEQDALKLQHQTSQQQTAQMTDKSIANMVNLPKTQQKRPIAT